MAYRNFKILLLTLIILTFYKCGKGAACAGNSLFIYKENLVVIYPLQNTYNQGDEVNVKVNIPTDISQKVFNISGNFIGKFGFVQSLDPITNLFTGNIITYIKGNSSSPLLVPFDMPFNFITGAYEFEIKVKLNRTGNYKILTFKNSDSILFQGQDECSTVTVETNKLNPSGTNEIVFTVI